MSTVWELKCTGVCYGTLSVCPYALVTYDSLGNVKYVECVLGKTGKIFFKQGTANF